MHHRLLATQDLSTLRARAHEYVSEVDRPVASPELAAVLLGRDAPEAELSPRLIRDLLRRDGRFHEPRRGTWDLVGARLHHVPLSRGRFCVVDVEATGSNPRQDEVIEVGVVVIENLRIVRRFESLVDPGVPIPSWIRDLTGISDETVDGAPDLAAIAPELVRILSRGVFVAHNVDFDERFLRARLGARNVTMPNNPTLCTVRLARRAVPGLDSYRLDALSEHFSIDLERHHRAVDDAEAAARLLLHLARGVLPDRGIETVGEMLAFSRTFARRAS